MLRLPALIPAFVFTLLFSFSQFSYGYREPAQYDFPFKDPYLNTALSALGSFLIPEKSKSYYYDLTLAPQNKNVPFFKGRNFTRFSLYVHKKQTRPLIFVIPGLGGQPYSGLAEVLAEGLYRSGFHVIVVTNPFSFVFNIGSSSHNVPGITELDIPELHRFMRAAYQHAKRKHKFQVSETHLTGYSLGGLQSAFLARYDETLQASFQFKKVLMINPPYNLATSAGRLDRVVSAYRKLTPRKKQRLEKKFWFTAFKLMDGTAKIEKPEDIAKYNIFTQSELIALIGQSFHQTLVESLFITEAIKKLGLFPLDPNHYSPTPFFDAAARYSYTDYFEKVCLPYIRKVTGEDISREEFVARNSVEGIADFLRENPRVHLHHNADDIILASGDIEKLDAIFGDRMLVYPYGGHMGTLWYEQNLRNIVGFFARP